MTIRARLARLEKAAERELTVKLECCKVDVVCMVGDEQLTFDGKVFRCEKPEACESHRKLVVLPRVAFDAL